MKWVIGLMLGVAVASGAQAAEMTREGACSFASVLASEAVTDYMDKGRGVRDFAIDLQKRIPQSDTSKNDEFLGSVKNAIDLATTVFDRYPLYGRRAIFDRFVIDCYKEGWDFRPLMTALHPQTK